MSSLAHMPNTGNINTDISLIKEEDSKDLISPYDNNDDNNEVLKYDLSSNSQNDSVNSPMQLRPLSVIKMSDEVDSNNIYTSSNDASAFNSRLTSSNSQFSETCISNRNSYNGYSDSEMFENSKILELPKLRSPFTITNSDEFDNTTTSTTTNNVQKKKRNRSLRWSYQGEIETINEVQKQKVLKDTHTKLFSQESVESPVKKSHKRTISLPYGKNLKVDTNLNNDSAGVNMISLKRRLSPSTFFKTQDEKEVKIKQQQDKIKDLELENLKQFSIIQELKSQTSYCIKEIEMIKLQSKINNEPKVNVQKSKSNTKISLLFKSLALLLVTITFLGLFYPELIMQSSFLSALPQKNYLDFFPLEEKLWYSLNKTSTIIHKDNDNLWYKIKTQIQLIKLVYKSKKLYSA
ncbi:hypothetical protein QEN19_000375 [Hanseniaspora menglaensis]